MIYYNYNIYNQFFLNIYHWREYEREKERARLQLDQQANLGETTEDSEGESTGGEQNN